MPSSEVSEQMSSTLSPKTVDNAREIGVDVIRQRLDAFRSSTDFDDLWPDVNEGLRHAAHRQIFAVTRCVLNDTAEDRHLPAGDEGEIRALGIAGYASGMGPLLGYWIETGAITADPPVAALLGEHLAHGRSRADEIFRHCIRLFGALGEREVVPTLMKGVYTSRRFFPEPGVRPMADLDLLIRPSERSAAEEALESLGFLETATSRGQASWSPPGGSNTVQSLELDHRSNPWSVDLHTSIDRSLTGGFWARMGQVPFEALCPWDIDGHTVRVFAQPLLLVHLAVHAATNIHELQLVGLVEMALVIREGVKSGDLQWDSALDLINELGVARFAHPTLELTERLVPGILDPSFRAQGLSMTAGRVGRVIDQRISSGLSMGGRRSADEIIVWARGPLEFLKAVACVLRDQGITALLKLCLSRLRLLMRRRRSWRTGS